MPSYSRVGLFVLLAAVAKADSGDIASPLGPLSSPTITSTELENGTTRRVTMNQH